ncbi:MAG: GNAT family N-acetyltransferase [Ruminococcus sp.]|nr:GNAT family N-acetyltransferase [Ruminococcus sp.]
MSNKLTLQEIADITNRFYSCFCCADISQQEKGIHFICSEERDKELKGFGCKYSIFILIKDDLCIVSYSPKYKSCFDGLRKCGVDEIISETSKRYKLKKMQLMIFGGETAEQYGGAKVLGGADYPLYEEFFRTAKPQADPDGWLYEYFTEKADKGYFSGYISNGRLVSVCETPDMPYMEEEIQHTGINTLQTERRKGYAKCTAALAAHNLIEKGVCPQWECEADNIASVELAKSIGYKQYGTAFILEEW